MKPFKKLFLLSLMSLVLSTGFVPMAWAGGDSGLDIRHMARELNLISFQQTARYLLLPVQDNAPEAKVFT